LNKAPAGSPGARHIEQRLSFYMGRKAMGITPGHENAGGLKYRTLDPSGTALRCFRCPTTGPVSLAADGAIEWTGAGVQCQSCHGPGAEHGKQPNAATIVNPRRFSPAQCNDYCGDCHRTAADITDWGLSWKSLHEPAFFSQPRCFEKAPVSRLTCHSAHQSVETNQKQCDAKCANCDANPKHRTPVPAASAWRLLSHAERPHQRLAALHESLAWHL
jgi:hypothetical protein